jgi:hypothetical protein
VIYASFSQLLKKGNTCYNPWGKALALISNVLRKGRALSYSHLSSLTKMGENPTKTWKL